MTIRTVLQAIEKGTLLVDNVEHYASVGRGVIVYVAFMDDVDDAAIQRAVRAILSTKIFHHLSSSCNSPATAVSLDDIPSADILIVPQASLGGKIKGKNVQFHALVPKSKGAEVYERFCALMRSARGVDGAKTNFCGEAPGGHDESNGGIGSVISGSYGNRQVLRFESEGPLTHFFDF